MTVIVSAAPELNNTEVEIIDLEGGKNVTWETNNNLPELTAKILSVSDEGIVTVEFSDSLYPVLDL